MPDSIKVGVITHTGGAHLSAYLPALAVTKECNSVVLCDTGGKWEASAREALGNKLTKTYVDYASLLKAEKPEMVLVTMEAALSPPVIAAALDAGCHVLAEKPSCVKAADFEQLAKTAETKHLMLMLAFANRIHPAMREARRLITSGALGDLYGLEMHIIADQTRLKNPAYGKNWFAHKDRAGGGHLIWLGIHWLDLAMFLTGSRITNVAGFIGNVGKQPYDVEDSAALSMRFDNGTCGTLTSGYYLDKGYHSFVKIWGSTGWLQLTPKDKTPLSWYSTREGSDAKIHEYTGPTEPQGYTPFVTECVRAAAGLGEAPTNSADALHVLRTIFAFYKAAESGQTQTV